MSRRRVEATMIGLGVPITAFGAALAASYRSRTPSTIPWLSASATGIAAVVSAAIITREEARKHQGDQKKGANGVEHPLSSKTNSESTSQPTDKLQSIMDFVTVAGGRKTNQDYVDARSLDGCNILAIADGVGFSPRGELAAKAAAEGFVTKIEEIWKQRPTIGRAEIHEAYLAASVEITTRVEQVKKQEGLDSLTPQTTFIGIIELADRFVFTYIGDGAIALFRADADAAASLLVPHSVEVFLTRYLGVSDEVPKPSYIEVDKTLEGGEIVVAGTDGALPTYNVLKPSQEIVRDLKHKFREDLTNFGRETVRRVLLQKVEDNFTNTDDNRTLGIILTSDALASWVQEKQREEEHQNESVDTQKEG